MTNPHAEPSSKPPNPASPTRPKHLTTRSISEVHKHHHSHLHHPNLHRRKEDPQSSHPNLGASGSFEGTSSKSEGVTPSVSRDVSRRGSVLEILEGNGRERRAVKEGEVREEREKGILRVA